MCVFLLISLLAGRDLQRSTHLPSTHGHEGCSFGCGVADFAVVTVHHLKTGQMVLFWLPREFSRLRRTETLKRVFLQMMNQSWDLGEVAFPFRLHKYGLDVLDASRLSVRLVGTRPSITNVL